MAYQDSYTELLKSYEYISRNFRSTRNVPIDIRFLVENIGQINEVIPKSLRYPGLIFFVKDSKVNDGTTTNLDGTKGLGSKEYGTDRITGILYCFDDNLEPIPLHDLITRFEIRLLKIDATKDDCYSKLIDKSNSSDETNSLNHLYSKIGNIVFVEPLGVAFICRYINGQPEWRYFAGSYTVSNEDQFYSIDKSLRQPNIPVLVGTDKKIITSSGDLSDEIIEANSTKECGEDKRFYNINGFIYYRFAGITIPVSNKFAVLKEIKLQKNIDKLKDLNHNWENDSNTIDLNIDKDNDTDTIFNSGFNTRNIIVDCIKEPEGDTIIDSQYANMRFPVQHKIINTNKINIISSIDVKNVTLIIRANE